MPDSTSPSRETASGSPSVHTPSAARVRVVTVLTFLVASLLGGLVVVAVENYRLQGRQKQAGDSTAHLAATIQDRLNRSLSVTYALAALIRQGNGRIDQFDPLGTEMLSLYDGISSLQLAPGGIIRQIVPLRGNEKAIGLNLLDDTVQGNEAVKTRRLALTGPFELVQGGQAVVGRLPVFLHRPDNSEYFWGMVAVVIRIPDFLDAVRLQRIVEDGFHYELSRIRPDTEKRDIFARSSAIPLTAAVRRNIEVPNGSWTLSLEPRTGWRSTPAIAAECFMALLFSTLLTIMLRTLYERPLLLRRMVDEQTRQLSGANQRLTSEIRERERAEEALRAGKEFYRTLVDNLPLGVALIDCNHRIVMANRTQSVWFGRAPESLIGQPCYEQFEQGEHTCPHCPGSISMQTGGVSQVNTEAVSEDGSRLAVRVRTVPLFDGNGTATGFIEVVEDITERKQAEAERHKLETQMQHAQKLESLGVLAGGIAHDFNNILMSILGHAELAMMRLNPASPARDNLLSIEQAAQRAADLSRQMLAYSGKGRFLVEVIDLGDLVAEMTHMLEVSISKKALLRFNRAPDLPAVEVDATQIRQVLMNLVINASEAIGDKSGVIAITTGAMRCDRGYLDDIWLNEQLSDGLYVYVEVADTGCGMDRDTLARIFDPFFTTKFTGRGLGMAAVLGIVRGHKGAIKIYSEPGKGTTFKILLPAISGHAARLSGMTAEEAPWRGSGTILLVDDEETIRALGQEMLEGLGFTVLSARDGREALEIFKERREEIRAVLLDLTMPRMDGEETFRELRRIRDDVRVIMSSGYNEFEVSQRFIGKGLTGFIQKPYKLSDLGKVLRQTLEPDDERPA